MNSSNDLARRLAQLEVEAAQCIRAGRYEAALALWHRALEIDPDHRRLLTSMGENALRSGDLPTACAALERLVKLGVTDVQPWINLALAYQGMKDEIGEENAIRGALRVDPGDLQGLILRAALLERQGKMHQAASAHAKVTAASPPLDQLRPDLRPAVMRAMAFRDRYALEFGAFLDQHLEATYKSLAGENLQRFRDSVDILAGRKKRYESRPAIYYYPSLPPVEFFDRAQLPWLDRVEAATDEIRQEFLDILQSEDGFTPYLTYPDDVDHHQFAELNNSPRWSAFHIYENGQLVEANAPKCPKTIALLADCPQPTQAGRTPTAMFSLLQPRTRIPPHTGVTNARLVTHLPLIVPEACGFRVGNDTREWVPGKAWVFDDTIEHEAWNNSDKLRVVLIFDIWHPHLTPPERAMVSAMAQATHAFSADEPAFGL
jgi:aspartyl/asparaginyl beta-hydroxylase (cupin superfamily)